MNPLRPLRLRFNPSTQATIRGLTAMRCISYLIGLAIVVGVVVDAYGGRKPKKGQGAKIRVGKPLFAMPACAPKALATGTSYDSPNSIAYSYWTCSCASGGGLPTPCSFAIKAVINRKDINNNWVFVDEFCMPYTLGCGSGGPATFFIAKIPSLYGTGYIYQVVWDVESGSCGNQGPVLATQTSAPFYYFPPLGAVKEPDAVPSPD